MAKFKGGRGHKAPYETKMVRVPVPLAPQVDQLIERYHQYITSGGDALSPSPLLGSQVLTEEMVIKLVDKINRGCSGYRKNSASGLINDLKSLLNM